MTDQKRKREDTLVRPLPDRFTLEATMKRRRRIQLLVAVVAALLAAGLGWALLTRGGDTTAAPAPTGTGASPTTSSSASPSATPSPTATVKPGSSEDVRFLDFHGARLPTSRTSGPYKVDGELASGFAETPLGAALAATHLVFRTTPDLGPAVFRPTIQRQVSGDAAAFLAQVTAQYETQRQARGLPPGAELQQSQAEVNAYRVDDYSVSGPVLVHVVVTDPSTATLVDVPVTVVWSGSDWKLVAPPSGTYAGTTVVNDTGYNHLPES